MSVINLDDFFEFGNQAPINRIAYTKEDAKYKLKCIKAMQDLGMEISIDYAGNICGTLKGKNLNTRSIVMGSHTDSVFNGGQFDGPVGVYMALKAVEDFKNSNAEQQGDLKVVIYACEESSRFSKACLGSHYLSGELSLEQLASLKDKQGMTFEEAVAEYRKYLLSNAKANGIDISRIMYVDKVLSQEEIAIAVESHIEQAEKLINSKTSIGVVDSISKPLRGEITAHGEDSILTSAKTIVELNSLAKKSKSEGKEEDLRITVPQFDSNDNKEKTKTVKAEKEETLFRINAKGKNNHSGATPMDQRQDAVLGLAHLIIRIEKLQTQLQDKLRAEGAKEEVKFEFLGSSTEKWGANQIQDNANLVLKIKPQRYLGMIKQLLRQIGKNDNVSFDIEQIEGDVTVSQNPYSKLFVDVRQQFPVTAKETDERIYNIFKEIQEKCKRKFENRGIRFKITDKGDPIQTSPELVKEIKTICDEDEISCTIMHSWPGHDIACVFPPKNKTGKRVLFFIQSMGGSHNPQESTTREAIEVGTRVYSKFVSRKLTKQINQNVDPIVGEEPGYR